MTGMGGIGGMGGLQPQMTGYNPFMAQQQQTGMQMPIQQQMTGFGGMQPQMSGFIQPQATGFNPFRQSIMPQPTSTFHWSRRTPAPGHKPMCSAPAMSLTPHASSAPWRWFRSRPIKR